MKFVYILLCITSLTYGQSIQGIITDDETKKPIENVTIQRIGHNDYGISDKNGHFTLQFQLKNSDTLVFKLLGYQDQKLSYQEFRKADNKVTLQKRYEDLSEVQINSESQQQKKLQFSKLAPMPEGVFNFASAITNGIIYVSGGNKKYIEDRDQKALDNIGSNTTATLDDLLREATRPQINTKDFSDKLQFYDIEQDKWTVADVTLRKRAFHGAAIYGNKLYVMGGKIFARNQSKEYLDNQIEIIDLESHDIVIDNTFPHQALNASIFNFNDNIIVMGGSIKRNSSNVEYFTNQSHIYNLNSGLWFELAEMKEKKQSNGILVGNIIYLVGGYDRTGLANIESYNLTTGKWTTVGTMFDRIKELTMSHHQGVIYMFRPHEIYTLDLATRTLHMYRIELNISSSAMYIYNDNLIIVGGSVNNKFSKTPSPDVFQIKLDQFDKTKIYKTKQL